MANSKTTTKPRRRPQPAKPIIPWKHRGIPDKPAARQRMLREIARTVDDQAIRSTLWWALANACESDTRRDLAELDRLRLAGRRTIPTDELVYIKDLTPAQAKRLKTMTTAELKTLAKQQAKARGKAVRS